MIRNRFKERLADGACQFGLWLTLSSGFATEVVAGKLSMKADVSTRAADSGKKWTALRATSKSTGNHPASDDPSAFGVVADAISLKSSIAAALRRTSHVSPR